VPFLQKAIAREGAAAGTPVWVTTGRSGTSAGPAATVAEANDIVNLLLDGVSGLVLTGESAVGTDPLDAIERVAQLLDGLGDFALQVTGQCDDTAGRHGTGDGVDLVIRP
jgi:pyruvate kinase